MAGCELEGELTEHLCQTANACPRQVPRVSDPSPDGGGARRRNNQMDSDGGGRKARSKLNSRGGCSNDESFGRTTGLGLSVSVRVARSLDSPTRLSRARPGQSSFGASPQVHDILLTTMTADTRLQRRPRLPNLSQPSTRTARPATTCRIRNPHSLPPPKSRVLAIAVAQEGKVSNLPSAIGKRRAQTHRR